MVTGTTSSGRATCRDDERLTSPFAGPYGSTFEYTWGWNWGEHWDQLISRNVSGATLPGDVRLYWSTSSGVDTGGQVARLDWRWDGTVDYTLRHGPKGNVAAVGNTDGVYVWAYDHAMRRVRKTYPVGGDFTRWTYGIDHRPLEETDCRGEPKLGTCDPLQRTELVYFMGQPVAAMHETSTGVELFHMHTDRMGVVRKVSLPDGTPVARVVMHPFGKAAIVSGGYQGRTPSLQYRYAGQYEDVESGLIENRYRSLIPELGIYTNVDPMHAPGAVRQHGPQAFTYAAGRPLLFTDPDGRWIYNTVTYIGAAQGGDLGISQPAIDGTVLSALTKAQMKWDAPTACVNSCNGCNYKFDVRMKTDIGTIFWANSSDWSHVPGKTLAQHEMDHVQDLRSWWAEPVVNGFVKTEGFSSKMMCDHARNAFSVNISNFHAWVEGISAMRDDYLKPTPPTPGPAPHCPAGY